MAVERTLILAKPDAVARNLAGEILARFERRGLKLRAARLVAATREIGETHYAEHSEKPFFGELVDFITSGPTLALVLEGEGAIATCRKTIGATNPADADPGSLRGEFALAMPNNLVHGSDSPESAEREIGIWFPDGLVCSDAATNAAALDRDQPRVHERLGAGQLGARRDLLGHLGDRRVRAERAGRRGRPRRRRARLRHRVLLGVAREARRPSHRGRHHARAARRRRAA